MDNLLTDGPCFEKAFSNEETYKNDSLCGLGYLLVLVDGKKLINCVCLALRIGLSHALVAKTTQQNKGKSRSNMNSKGPDRDPYIISKTEL